MTKKDVPLILGLLLPFLVVVIVFVNYFYSNLSYHPQYNFIYSVDNQYGQTVYSVQNKKLIKKPDAKPEINAQQKPAQLFFYDVKKEKSLPLTLDQAQQFELDTASVSPDGFKTKIGSDAEAIMPVILVSGDRTRAYLVGHSVSKKINIPVEQNYYWGFHFIGWITNERK